MSINNNFAIAVVCSSNMNRSMEAHNFLAKKGFNVRSFGTGERVKLPGTAIDKPNIYEFGTPYDVIYNDLVTKDKQYYTQNGLLHMLDRNRRIKKCPERFQECSDKFDIIITVEERVYDQVLEYMESQDTQDNRPVHIFNVNIEDNHEEALMGAFLIADMINMVKIIPYQSVDQEIFNCSELKSDGGILINNNDVNDNDEVSFRKAFKSTAVLDN
uniref:RNA polymerase II subunit A C-terminal domain phosphatase SSU72 n=1 Tax=Glossina brevipalpis TaxID=37001 RepID=A0A1A9WRD5_9MUSC